MSGLGHGPGQPSSPAVSAGPSGSARYGGGPRESPSPMSFTVARRGTLIDGLDVGKLVLEVFSSLQSGHVGLGLRSSLDPTHHGEESLIHGHIGVVFRCPLETVRGRSVARRPGRPPRLAAHGHMAPRGGHDLNLLSGVPLQRGVDRRVDIPAEVSVRRLRFGGARVGLPKHVLVVKLAREP